MHRVLYIVFIVSGFLMLTSCAGAYQTLNDASIKHDGSLVNSGQSGNATAQKCDQWCHNGWCTTHCANT